MRIKNIPNSFKIKERVKNIPGFGKNLRMRIENIQKILLKLSQKRTREKYVCLHFEMLVCYCLCS